MPRTTGSVAGQRKYRFWEPYFFTPLPKHVNVVNTRMGLMYRGMQLLVVWFIVRGFYYDPSWMIERSQPNVVLTFHANPNTHVAEAQKASDKSLPHCNDPESLAYQDHNETELRAHGCTLLVQGQEWSKGDNSLSVPTFFSDHWLHQTSGERACGLMSKCCGKGNEVRGTADEDACKTTPPVLLYFGEVDLAAGMSLKDEPLCTCKATRSYYVRGTTGMNISLRIDYSAVTGGTPESGSTDKPHDNVLVVVPEPIDNSKPGETDAWEKGDYTNHPSLVGEAHHPRGRGHNRRESRDEEEDDNSMILAEKNEVKAVEVGVGGSVKTMRKEAFPHRDRLNLKRERQLAAGQSSHTPMLVDTDDVAQEDVATIRHASESTGFSSKTEASSYEEGHPIGIPNDVIFQPGETITMTLEDWIRHAVIDEGPPMATLNSETDSVLDADNKGVANNSIAGARTLYPSFRTTGLDISFDVNIENARVHHNNPELKKFKHNGSIVVIKPVAAPSWNKAPVTHTLYPMEPLTGTAIQLQREFHVVTIRFVPHGSFGCYSVAAIMSGVSSAVIALQIPAAIMALIMIFLMGYCSEYYYEASFNRMSMKHHSTGFIARAIGHIRNFGGGSGKAKDGVLRREDLVQDVMRALKCNGKEETTYEQAAIAVDLLLAEHSDNRDGIQVEELAQAAMENEDLFSHNLHGYIDPGASTCGIIDYQCIFQTKLRTKEEKDRALQAAKEAREEEQGKDAPGGAESSKS